MIFLDYKLGVVRPRQDWFPETVRNGLTVCMKTNTSPLLKSRVTCKDQKFVNITKPYHLPRLRREVKNGNVF